ncbi:Vegetative incompatibility protein HET-E-1 [Colletotrichum fructicola]|uniref:Ankyrin repeat-containing protein n=2 Tax=Colletotrichum fructicola (strain Nara gc5) TaxID=1213859 RepID=L2FWL3_COLFN|nr:Vegetative incompatibility protein HET-E-1 [Colletotrichum fructicola]
MDVATSSAVSAGEDAASGVDSKDAYTVGWICALPLEMAAAKLMLDEIHEFRVEQDDGDHNAYILGQMKGHKVVIACLPKGVYGTVTAATVAKDMLRTFKSIRFGLMVGIGGGVPSSAHDIRLGDVVVSIPTDVDGGVIQYDRGKTGKEGEFIRIGSLNAPPTLLLTAAGKVETNHSLGESDMPQLLAEAVEKIQKPKIRQKYVYQEESNDCLFRPEYEHVDPDIGCNECDAAQTVQREKRDDTDPVAHYGNIASGNQVIKHAETRDRLSRELGVLCFEMEAAGLMQEFPCLVIRGICDYSDSHKNKRWQEYAAATAAAYGKELLSVVTPQRVEKEKPILYDPQIHNLLLETREAILRHTKRQETHYENNKNRECINGLFQTDPVNDMKRILLDKGGLLEGSCQWILDLPEYQRWNTIPHGSRLWIKGDPGK